MCSSNYSSSWVEDERKLAKTSIHKDHFKARVDFYDKNNFKWSIENDIVKSIKHNSQTLERIHFAGGEPLLSKQHNELLHYLIDTGISKNLMISYNTNITLIDKTVIELWNQFKHVKVFLSIDGTGDVLEYIRYPIMYSNVLEIFDLIEEHSNDNIRYVMHYTVNALNLLNIPDFVEYKIKLPYTKISPTELLTIDCVLGPNFLAINVLPKNLVDAVLTRLSELTVAYPMYHMTIQSMHDKILTSYNTSGSATLNDTIAYCRDLDSMRNTDSSFILDSIQAYL
jgi:sulfatase maturation enzyme AslB (radical SAM superfamily)